MSRAGRAESAVQVSLMLAVGAVAGAASFTHVRDLAAGHGQGGWLSVAIALVVETMALSSGLEVRRRRRTGQGTAAVLTVLIASVALSLACQVADAERSAWGWLMAAVPALGFLVLVKIALGRTGTGPASPQITEAPVRVPMPAAELEPSPVWLGMPSGPRLVPALAAPQDQGQDRAPSKVDGLLLAGQAVASELASAGRPLTRSALAEGVRDRGHAISTTRASELLKQLRAA